MPPNPADVPVVRPTSRAGPPAAAASAGDATLGTGADEGAGARGATGPTGAGGAAAGVVGAAVGPAATTAPALVEATADAVVRFGLAALVDVDEGEAAVGDAVCVGGAAPGTTPGTTPGTVPDWAETALATCSS